VPREIIYLNTARTGFDFARATDLQPSFRGSVATRDLIDAPAEIPSGSHRYLPPIPGTDIGVKAAETWRLQ
jgi:hypothetical protein